MESPPTNVKFHLLSVLTGIKIFSKAQYLIADCNTDTDTVYLEPLGIDKFKRKTLMDSLAPSKS